MTEPDAAALIAAQREKRAHAARQESWWVWTTVIGELRNSRERARQLRAWWVEWRHTPSSRVALTFVLVYALLAFMRTPSDAAIERTVRAQEAEFLQDYLRSYCVAGGTVLTERPHGGSEIFPRGVLLQGDLLAAFRRAPLGGLITVTLTEQMWNPLLAFRDFPPVFQGGKYFQLERKFDFSRYRFLLLLRKDSEKAGVLLVARVDPAA